MRPIPTGAAALALLFASLCARADDVELRTGRTLSGKIVGEDDASVTIEWRGGTMRVERTQIKEIRRAPPPADPVPAPAKGSGAKKPAAPAPQGDAAKTPAKTPAKPGRTFADRLAAIEAIRLTPWVEEPSVLCKEPGAKSYKVVRTDGATTMTDERPASSSGIAALYVRNDSDYGRMIVWKDGARLLYWYRLHWHDDAREWRVNHPDLEAFQKDSAEARLLAGDVCSDQNFMVAAACDVRSIEYGMQGGAAYDAAKERAKLAEDCRKAMGSDQGGQALAEYHECTIRIDFAKSPAGKVRGATERRAILRRLVAATLVK